MNENSSQSNSSSVLLVDGGVQTPTKQNENDQQQSSNRSNQNNLSSPANLNLNQIDKQLKLQMKIEQAKQREAEKEKREREKREREELKQKREAELKKKREEEESLRKQKAEEQRLKKEEERLKREEEKEKKLQEKLEQERKRQEIINAKNEEKKKRDEERKQKEEEKQREEEEKRRKVEKVKSQFVSYFIKKEAQSNTCSNDRDDNKMYRFMPFQLKENMSLAPLCRRTDFLNMNEEQRSEFINKIDQHVLLADEPDAHCEQYNYLKEIKANPNIVRKQIATCRRRNKQEQQQNSCEEIKIVPVITSNLTQYKVKYLEFDRKVYRRPPYFGTWRKRSNVIRPRNPFAKDEKLIDYEIDSDDEWEDEPEGESLDGSDKGDAEEEVLDDEDDDGFFVPHGHLSDDEMDEDERLLDPETKKARENAKKEQWEAERKKGSKVLVPKCFICTNITKERLANLKPSELNDLRLLNRLKMIPLVASFPITIHNDEFLEKKAALKAAEEAANKLAAKNAKAAQLENLNVCSPTSLVKSKKVNNKHGNIQNSPSASTAVSSSSFGSSNSNANQNSSMAPFVQPATTPSIINFISKMSNKKVLCKLERISGNAEATTQPASPTSASSALSEFQPLKNIAETATTKIEATPAVSKIQSVSNSITPSSKPSVTGSCSTAEKRSVQNGKEPCLAVKRLKLDPIKTNDDENSSCSPSVSSKMLNFQPSSSSSSSSILKESRITANSPIKMDVENPVKAIIVASPIEDVEKENTIEIE